MSIGRDAGARVQVSHCKAAGRSSHGKGRLLVDRLATARRDGIDVYGDQYPYLAGATVLAALLPTHAGLGGAEAMSARLRDPHQRTALRTRAERGGVGDGLWSQVTVTAHRVRANVGRTLRAVTGDHGDPWDTLCDLVDADPSAAIVLELMAEGDVVCIMANPLIGIGSDSGTPVGLQHPRTWGTFPKLFGTYVREQGVLTLEEAIRKATSLAARQFNLFGRGRLAAGTIADVCVFDPRTVGHAGSYDRPSVPPTGIHAVVLGGTVVVREGVFAGERAGRVLRPGRPASPHLTAA
jgi:N-acyl-D-amino-acid deacylase